MKSFLKRLSIFGLLPFTILVAGYIQFDPFKVIYEYDDYSKTSVILNRDFVSTTQYVKNNGKYHYNSFIFGSSRTIAFKAKTWKTYLDKDAVPFVFDGAAESIYGINAKLKYLDKQNAKLDNVLIVMCRDWSFANKKDISGGHLFKKHPLISGRTRANFHFTMFKAYLNTNFLLAYYYNKFSGEFKDWMTFIINQERFTLDPITNEMNVFDVDQRIAKNPKQHVIDHAAEFYERKRETIDSVDRIDYDFEVMLTEIKQILEKRKVNYKIVAGPIYDQVKFTPHDKAILVKLFGKNFYDYTGKNKFSDDKENYYETSHYRPIIGEAILKEIYQDDKKKTIVN